MIIPNGHIKITSTTGGGILNGKPRRAVTTTSGAIDANIAESNRSHGEVAEQTVATKASYVVLIDPADAPTISDRDKVEIFDRRGVSLGTYDVQSARLLDFVDVIKISV
jgi:hypothetical protein